MLDYKKKKHRQICHSSTKLIASDSDIDESFKPMHQSVITKRKKYVYKDWTALDAIIKHIIKVF